MNLLTFWDFFTDPVLRAPTLGAMLMCLSSSLIGVIVFIRRRSLLGEALSHAAYPGVVAAVIAAAFFFDPGSPAVAVMVLIGASLFALLGYWSIEKLEKSLKVKPDAALCLVLSLFLGLGVVLASRLQMTHPIWVQQIHLFLYGQAATMTDSHIGIYALLSLGMFLFVILRFRQIELIHFDLSFSKSLGVPIKGFQSVVVLLLICALVVGMRSVGVVLMAGMLIAPAIFARQMSRHLGKMFLWAGGAGMVSGVFGVYLSVKIPLMLNSQHPISLPTGPMILLVAASLALMALLFSPDRGVCSRLVRVRRFRLQQHVDHILKIFWKEEQVSRRELQKKLAISPARLIYLLAHLRRGGWVLKGTLGLSPDGKRRGAQLVRLHRLWELYLTSELNVGEDRVHASAEEMEHILTPEIERELTQLLENPKKDPHNQPIPSPEDPLCTL